MPNWGCKAKNWGRSCTPCSNRHYTDHGLLFRTFQNIVVAACRNSQRHTFIIKFIVAHLPSQSVLSSGLVRDVMLTSSPPGRAALLAQRNSSQRRGRSGGGGH